MLFIQSFEFNPLQENTYVLYDETKECVIIDPGCFETDEKKELTDFLERHQLQVKMLLNTHCHVDHVLGNYYLKEKFKTQLLIPAGEVPVLQSAKILAPLYGFHQYEEATPDGYLEEGDTITFGSHSLSVIFAPGHSPGHVVFYNEPNGILISGDVLFYNSIGRTDLPGGDHNTLLNSIRQKLFRLPDSIKVYPGHGPETTIGFEKRTNPFCAVLT